MNVLMKQAVLLAASLMVVHESSAGKMLDSRDVSKSPYYTGKVEAGALTQQRLPEWMAYRKLDKEPKHILDQGFIVDDSNLVQPLYDITNQLLAKWPGEKPEMAIFLKVGDPSSVYGGQTLIANEILISYGTLVNVRSDDELAAVLAHELAHILLKHNKRNKDIISAGELFDYYESAKILKDTIDATSLEKQGDRQYQINIDESNELMDSFRRADAQKKRASAYYQAYHASSFSRGAEIDADLLAADLLIAAGYSPIGLKHSLERLSSSYELEKMLSETLSSSAAALANEAKSDFQTKLHQLSESGEVSGLEKNIDQLKQSFLEDLEKKSTDAAWRFFNSSHPVPEKRMNKLSDYLNDNYGRRERSRKPSHTIIDGYANGVLKLQIERYDEAGQAEIALLNEQQEQALAHARKAISGVTKGDGYTRYVAYQVRQSEGKNKLAMANVERIDSYLQVPNSLLGPMLFNMAKQGRSDGAGKGIAEKESYGGEIVDFYPAKIQLAINNNDREKAIELAQQCLDAKDASKVVTQRCQSFGLVAQKAKSKGGGFLDMMKSAGSSLNDISNSMTQ